jgi:aarF domain-containing kinase
LCILGPFFIKLGQALSIRPDILSPKAMVELQKLCDKVPSYDNKLAMATIAKELGKPVDEIFSELTTDPIGTPLNKIGSLNHPQGGLNH